MNKFIIEGGKPLSGKIRVQGAKNAALPIIAASLLAEGTHIIHDVPQLLDVEVMVEIMQSLGAKTRLDQYTLVIDTSTVNTTTVPDSLMGKMRSSIFLMGPLLAKYKKVSVSKPGGCAIGERKIDLHLKGLKALGATIIEEEDKMICYADDLYGGTVILDYPSVGATENIMMAASLAKGTTTIRNAAKEPEIIDLQNFLNVMGGKVSGAGTDKITIEGVKRLNPITYQIIPDRIYAGTMMIAAGITGGYIELENVIPEHLSLITDNLKRTGLEINLSHDIIIVKPTTQALQPLTRILTAPYPGFPTDMQAQFMALLTIAKGSTIIEEKVFDSRFKHVRELMKMGANIRIDENKAIVTGVDHLHGAEVKATDLRAGAALVLAGLGAQGQTIVDHIFHIDRGYENLEVALQSIGAQIRRK